MIPNSVNRALLLATLSSLSPPHFLAPVISTAATLTKERLVIVLFSRLFNSAPAAGARAGIVGRRRSIVKLAGSGGGGEGLAGGRLEGAREDLGNRTAAAAMMTSSSEYAVDVDVETETASVSTTNDDNGETTTTVITTTTTTTTPINTTPVIDLPAAPFTTTATAPASSPQIKGGLHHTRSASFKQSLSHTAQWDDVQSLLTFVYVQATKVAQDMGKVLMEVDVLLLGLVEEVSERLPRDIDVVLRVSGGKS